MIRATSIGASLCTFLLPKLPAILGVGVLAYLLVHNIRQQILPPFEPNQLVSKAQLTAELSHHHIRGYRACLQASAELDRGDRATLDPYQGLSTHDLYLCDELAPAADDMLQDGAAELLKSGLETD